MACFIGPGGSFLVDWVGFERCQDETDIDRALIPGVPGLEQMNLTREEWPQAIKRPKSSPLLRGGIPGQVMGLI